MPLPASTKDVEQWWSEHPFTAADGMHEWFNAEQVGKTLAFFEKVESRYRRRGTYQKDGAPLLSNYIDYSSLRGKRVLDIATGTGFLAVEFARQGAEVTAIDLTQTAVDMATNNLGLRGLDGTVLRMDAQHMDFPDNSFDFVSAHGCLMHMPDTAKAVSEIHRVLKPGGSFYAWFYQKRWYYWFNILLLRGVLCGALVRHNFDVLKLTSLYTDGLDFGGNPHTRFYSQTQLRKMFEFSGLSDVVTATTYSRGQMMAWPMRRLPLGRYLPESLRRLMGSRLSLGARVGGKKPV